MATDRWRGWGVVRLGTSPNMRLLKWLAIVLPIAFLVVVDIVRHAVFSQPFSSIPAFLAVHSVIAAAVVIFSYSIFGLIGRLQRRIVDQNRHLSALNNIASLAAAKPRLQELLAASLDHILSTMKADAGLICLVDLDREEHSVVCHRGFSPELVQRVQGAKLRDDPVAQEVVRTGRPVILERVFQDPRVSEAAKREGILSGISGPLKSEGEVNGILAIATRTERRFSDADQQFLDGIGGQLGMAIRNAVLYEQLRLHNRELAALLAVGKAVASSLDLDQVLSRSLATIIEVTTADAAEMWLAEGDAELIMRRHRGLHREAFLERTRFHMGEGIPGMVAQSQKPIVVHDLPAAPHFLRQKVTRAGFHTFCALPVQYRDKLLGVLTVAALSAEALREPRELRLLEGIGERLAIAIENAQLHQQVQDMAVLQERERIAREMHDGMAQLLGYINTQTLAVKKLLSNENIGEALEELTRMEEIARDLYADVREGILGLRTAPHRNGGFIPALREYVERYAETSDIDATFQVVSEADFSRLPPSAEIQLVRIVQEALSNVRKHARATAVDVTVQQEGNEVKVGVADNGQGFDPARHRSTGWPRFGLQTMQERAQAVGGSFTLDTAPGEGTRVSVRVPLAVDQTGGAQT